MFFSRIWYCQCFQFLVIVIGRNTGIELNVSSRTRKSNVLLFLSMYLSYILNGARNGEIYVWPVPQVNVFLWKWNYLCSCLFNSKKIAFSRHFFSPFLPDRIRKEKIIVWLFSTKCPIDVIQKEMTPRRKKGSKIIFF